jgi:hypothetical protein
MPLLGFGRKRKIPSHRFPTVGIVWKVLLTRTQLSHKHHHHGGAICPSYGVVSLDTPDRTWATFLEGVGHERVGLVLYKTIKKLPNEFNSTTLLVFLTYRSYTVKNGGQNGIHHRRWAPILYKKVNNILMNILVTRIYFILIIPWSLALWLWLTTKLTRQIMQGMVQAWVSHFVTPLKCTYDEYG